MIVSEDDKNRYGDVPSAVRGHIETAKKLGRNVKFSFNEVELEVSPQSHDIDIFRIHDLKREILLLRRTIARRLT